MQDAGTTLRAESEVMAIGGGSKAVGDKELAELLDLWVGFQRQAIKVPAPPAKKAPSHARLSPQHSRHTRRREAGALSRCLWAGPGAQGCMPSPCLDQLLHAWCGPQSLETRLKVDAPAPATPAEIELMVADGRETDEDDDDLSSLSGGDEEEVRKAGNWDGSTQPAESVAASSPRRDNR